MCRISATVTSLAVLSLALASIAGCPVAGGDNGTGDGGGGTSASTIAGTWSGTLDCTRIERLGEQEGTPRPGTRDVTITFSSQFVPVGLPIWGFTQAFDQTTTKSGVGESETFEFGANFPTRVVTLVVTIAEASYSESGATVVMDLQYTATSGSLTQEGTGTMTIQAAVEGDSLTFSGVAQYDVTQTAGTIVLETGETISCTGTLTRQ